VIRELKALGVLEADAEGLDALDLNRLVGFGAWKWFGSGRGSEDGRSARRSASVMRQHLAKFDLYDPTGR
jgi:hypothetical protein